MVAVQRAFRWRFEMVRCTAAAMVRVGAVEKVVDDSRMIVSVSH